MFERLFRVRLLGSTGGLSGGAENATDLRGAFDVLIEELKDPKQIITYKQRTQTNSLRDLLLNWGLCRRCGTFQTQVFESGCSLGDEGLSA